jgi:peptidoglycan/LPS O-acetylase OafA/YrhL
MSQKPVYMAQLDGLRAFAVLAVLMHHLGEVYFDHPMGVAAVYGVKLFFVLSGFLITGILLRAADKVHGGQTSVFQAMKRFYARRTLRIFPLYYTVVLVCCVLNVTPAREVVGWLLSYTLNIKMAGQGWYEATFAHFWSLCVEEQFYVTWPWLVLFVPARWRLRLVFSMLLVAPLLRIAYVLSGYTLMTGLATYISTLMCLDSLGTGALLAILSHQGLPPLVSKYMDRLVMPVAVIVVFWAELWDHGRLWTPAFLVHGTFLRYSSVGWSPDQREDSRAWLAASCNSARSVTLARSAMGSMSTTL